MMGYKVFFLKNLNKSIILINKGLDTFVSFLFLSLHLNHRKVLAAFLEVLIFNLKQSSTQELAGITY